MTNTTTPWWEAMELRDELTSGDGAIDDVQMSLHDAVFGQPGVGAGRTPYADAAYFGSITHPTATLVELMARVAVRLGAPSSTQTRALWRLDQAMGGGKSHGLIGLWHLATNPVQLAETDLGKTVMSTAEQIAGAGTVRADLGNPVCVVLDCDNTTATKEDFGPAQRLGERFLWRLFEKDGNRYDKFKEHITNKSKMAEALGSVGRPVLVLVDEIMDYIRVVAAADADGAVLDMAFLRVLLDVINDVPNCAAVVVMIASEQDNMAMNEQGSGYRSELEDLLTRNARTTAVTGGGDFVEIIKRRLFDAAPPAGLAEATADGFWDAITSGWHKLVFTRLPGYSESEFRERVMRCYPFHPDLIALAETEWAQQAGFQRVRSIIRVFAGAVHEQARRAGQGQWAPELIDSGDLPLESNLLREALLNSGLVADNKTQANLREVARVDIGDPANPQQGAARRLDARRSDGWATHNPRAAERMATALFVRSLYSRPNGARGAIEAELFAASFVPNRSYGHGDAQASGLELLDSDDGAASVAEIPGRGSAAKRWVFETRKTLMMLTKAEKKAVSDVDRDKAVTDRAYEIATTGPFDKIVKADGGEAPTAGVTAQGCREVLESAGIDDRLQTRLVVLDSRWFSLFNGDDSATRKAVAAAVGTGPDAMSVQWASSAVFACANTAVRGQARGLAAEWIARDRVAELPAIKGDPDSLQQARQAAKEAKERLDNMVRQCYKHIIYLASDGTHGRKVAFVRIGKDKRSALNGSDVWAELNDDRKAFNPGQLTKAALLSNLRDNDYGLPLSEIRDSFWSNPHKPLLPAGAGELRDAVYDAVKAGKVELVDADGSVYTARASGDINLASDAIRIREPTCETCGEPKHECGGHPPCPSCGQLQGQCSCPSADPTTTTAGTGTPSTTGGPTDPGGTGGASTGGSSAGGAGTTVGSNITTRQWQITLNIAANIDPENPDDNLRQLLLELINRIDDGHVSRVTQMTQITLVADQQKADKLQDLANRAGTTINIQPV